MNADMVLYSLLALPVIASAFIYLIGRLVVRKTKRRNPACWIALVFLLLDILPLTAAASLFLQTDTPLQVKAGAISLTFDGISLLMAAVTLGLGILATMFSCVYMRSEDHEEKFYALLSAMIGLLMGLACTNDLFNLWVWFEGMAISSFFLVAFYRNQPASLEAGFKYLVQSATGSVLVVMGIALVFARTGTLALDEIRAVVEPSPVLLAAGALFIIGFGVKSALVPLHTWLPDAHSQAPSGISAMLSGVVIEAGLVAMLRALGGLSAISGLWGPLLLGFGAVNMLLGNLVALRQTQVKRLLAYSSLSHMGYILLGIGGVIAFGNLESAAGGFFHIVTHALMKGSAFLSAGALLYCLHLSRGSHDALVLDDLNGAARQYPLIAFCFSVALLSLGGLPPLAGFMSKWQIFVGGFQSGNGWMIALVIFAALNSVLSLGYYAPMVNRLYRTTPGELVAKGNKMPAGMAFPLVILTAAIIALGFLPSLAKVITYPAAQSLLAAFGGF